MVRGARLLTMRVPLSAIVIRPSGNFACGLHGARAGSERSANIFQRNFLKPFNLLGLPSPHAQE